MSKDELGLGKLVERLTPRFVNDLLVSHAVSQLRADGARTMADTLSEWIVANNALKREAAAAITALIAERDALAKRLDHYIGMHGANIRTGRRLVLRERARAEAAEAQLKAARELVEQAFRDGLTYGGNVASADPDLAWQHSRARALLKDTPR